ncbi:MAG: protein-L-isoaspartate(D-aspartate) O-methyltransferase [bacterium]|nr:protein-L-isoaspartate(D-aspartate) O-methyltransferase [bacterium]
MFFCCSCGQEKKSEQIGFNKLREQMVQQQIIARGIKDPVVLAALRKVERHLFVPVRYQKEAYNDYPLPIGEDQTISQPYIVALMTEVLKLKPEEKVLEIGTGSGYQAAVLAEISKNVYTIEIIPALATTATKRLTELGYTTIKVKCGDGYQGWKEYAPFDAIIVTCAPDEIPPKLIEQLKDGGRMVIPVGEKYTQTLYLVEKRKGTVVQKGIIPVLFVPMVHGKESNPH